MSQPIAPSKPKPKGALIAALVFFLLGVAGCGFAAAKTIPYISDVVDFVTDLDQVANVRPMGEPITFTATGADGIALLSGEAVCTGEGGGGPLSFQPYESFGPGTTVELGGTTIDGYILFDTTSGEDYTITCGAGGTGSYVATTAPSFLVDGVPGFATGIGAGAAGAIFVLISIILLIVGLVQRSSWKKRNQGGQSGQYPPQQGGPPPPGQQAVPPAPGQNAWGSPQPPQGMPPQGQPPQAQPPAPPMAPPAAPPAPGTPPPFTGGTPQPPPTPGPGSNPPPPQ